MKTTRLIPMIAAIAAALNVYAGPSRVTDLRVINITSTTFTLEWTVPSTPATVAENDIRLSLEPINSLNWNSRVRITGVPVVTQEGSKQTFLISGATPATTFYVALRVRDSSGAWSLPSNVPVFTTAGWSVLPVISQVTLAWDRNPEPDIAGYRIYYGVGSRAYTNTLEVGNVTNATVSGLVGGVTYYFAASAYNTAALESALSAEVSYPPAPPSRETPLLEWAVPADIVYGTKLSSVQLSARATHNGTNVPGKYVYGPTVGAVMAFGSNQTISVMFLPNDPARYVTVSAEVKINVRKAPLQIALYNKTKVYGRSLPSLSGKVVGLVNGDTVSSTGIAVSMSTTATKASDVGVYPITAVVTKTPANYEVAIIDGVLTVTKATLTLSSQSKWRYRWMDNPILTYTYSGLVGGDTMADFSPRVVLSTLAVPDSLPGYYPVRISQTSNSNYLVRYREGNLRVVAPTSPLLVVRPAYSTYAEGSRVQYTAQYVRTDGTATDVTTLVVWASSSRTIATIAADGVADCKLKGYTVITAYYGTMRGSTKLYVITNAPAVAQTVLSKVTEIPVKIRIRVSGGGRCELVITGPIGASFTLEQTTDFRKWTDVLTGTFETGEGVSFLDQTTSSSRRFYRVKKRN